MIKKKIIIIFLKTSTINREFVKFANNTNISYDHSWAAMTFLYFPAFIGF